MKKIVASVLIAAGCWAGGVGMAVAQDELPKPEVGQEQIEESVVAEKTVYDFVGDVVKGELKKPDGDTVTTRLEEELSSLIEVRSDFVDKMVISAEDL